MRQGLRLHRQIVKDKKTGWTEIRHMAQLNKLALFYPWSSPFVLLSFYSYIASSQSPSITPYAMSLCSSKIVHTLPIAVTLRSTSPSLSKALFQGTPAVSWQTNSYCHWLYWFLVILSIAVFQVCISEIFFLNCLPPSHGIPFQQGPHQVILLK